MKYFLFLKHPLSCLVVAWFGLLYQAPVSSSENSTHPFGLVISGGVSLGVYEAGLNWVYIEALKSEYERTNNAKFKLDSVTGTSAGSINSILSALRFCEIESRPSSYWSNLFYKTWNIGITDLLPPENGDYDSLKLGIIESEHEIVSDSVFARSAFTETIDRIRTLADLPNYKPDCSVKIALIVTNSKPQVTDLKSVNKNVSSTNRINIPVQRFVIPIQLETYQNEGEANARVKFTNYLNFSDVGGLNNRHIFLPQNKGEIDVDNVIRAALASSAFPLAFGRVRLMYCSLGENTNNVSKSTYCPDEYRLNTAYFVDGGIFDNVPLRAAVDLVEGNSDLSTRSHYIFIDPDIETEDYGQSSDDLKISQIENDKNNKKFELVSHGISQLSYIAGQHVDYSAVLKANIAESDLLVKLQFRHESSSFEKPDYLGSTEFEISTENRKLVNVVEKIAINSNVEVGRYKVDISIVNRDGNRVWASENVGGFNVSDNGKLTLEEQIGSVLPAITTLRAQELNTTLEEKFIGEKNESLRTLLISKRSKPLTGFFLANFGAFLDPVFRRYDYSVGIYDGLRNVAEYLCDPDYVGKEYVASRCKDGESQLIAELARKLLYLDVENNKCELEGSADITNICSAVKNFLNDSEPGEDSLAGEAPQSAETPDLLKPVNLISHIFEENNSIGFPDFLEKLRENLLSNSREYGAPEVNLFGAIITDVMQRESPDWMNDILVAFVSRLYDIEKSNQGLAEKQLAALWVMTPYTNVGGKLKKNLSPYKNYSPYKQRYSNIDRVLPYFAGVDGAQTGTVWSWHTRRFPVGFITDKSGVNLNFFSTLNFQFDEEDRARKGSTSLGAAINSERQGSFLFSSVGANLFASYDKIGVSAKPANVRPGLEVYLGFLGDKFRISLGNRDLEHVRGNWMIRVGITELHRFLPLVWSPKSAR